MNKKELIEWLKNDKSPDNTEIKKGVDGRLFTYGILNIELVTEDGNQIIIIE